MLAASPELIYCFSGTVRDISKLTSALDAFRNTVETGRPEGDDLWLPSLGRHGYLDNVVGNGPDPTRPLSEDYVGVHLCNNPW